MKLKGTRVYTIEELIDHAKEISQRHRIQVIEDDSLQPHEAAGMVLARVGQRNMVVIPKIKDDTGYAAVMHEFGHCLHPTGSVRSTREELDNMKLKILEEESAWDWAYDNALCWTVAMEQVHLFAVESYYAEQRKRVQHEITKAAQRRESISDFLKRGDKK